MIFSMFFENHIPISSFEHQHYLWKDVVFWGLLFENFIAVFYTYKHFLSTSDHKTSRFFILIFFWLLGVISVVLLSKSK